MTDTAPIALVTGASRGIGQAIAEALSRAGFAVVGTATRPEGVAAIDARFAAEGLNGRGAVYDASQAGSAEALIAHLEAADELPMVLVNNAGISRDGLLLRMKPEDWEQTLSINLTAAIRLSKLCLKRMLKDRAGRIINISSVIGSIGNAGQTPYSAAKAGLEGFSRALARELAGRNITVNSVAPGFIETDMTAAMTPEARTTMSQQIPLERLGTAEDIANVVTFLASDRAAYITGQVLVVDGGLVM